MPKENIYNDLYESAKNGETFTNLMPLVLSRENILLAYRNIKNNAESKTAGTDKLTTADIGKMTPEEVTAKVRYIVSGTKRGYIPKPIRRKDIPKPNGETRKRIAQPQTNKNMHGEIHKYNLMVMGMQNYYRIATNINLDYGKISRVIITVISNRLKGISRKGRKLTPAETIRYGKTKMLRYLMGEPIYPIGYVQHKNPLCKRIVKSYEVEGTKIELLSQQLYNKSIEYADNRISLYRAQKGRCAVTGEKFTSTDEIHCHHKIPKSQGGTDDYQNLILVTVIVHKLIHAIHDETIKQYLQACKPNLKKLNVLRKLVG